MPPRNLNMVMTVVYNATEKVRDQSRGQAQAKARGKGKGKGKNKSKDQGKREWGMDTRIATDVPEPPQPPNRAQREEIPSSHRVMDVRQRPPPPQGDASKACRHFAVHRCSYGSWCQFSHRPEDIRAYRHEHDILPDGRRGWGDR